MAMRFKDLEFVCPHCNRTHNVKKFLEDNRKEGNTKLDVEFTEEYFSEDGRVRISYPECKCECGHQFMMDFENGYCIIFDDNNDIVLQEGYELY